MTRHDCQQYDPTCFRCDLSRTENSDPLRDTLERIRRLHRPDDLDHRLCREGCVAGWPCDTYEAADYALIES